MLQRGTFRTARRTARALTQAITRRVRSPSDDERRHGHWRVVVATLAPYAIKMQGRERDDDEDNVVWTKICDAMWPLIDNVMELKPQTLPGLAVQARAVSLAEWGAWEGHSEARGEWRIFMENACRLLNVVPALVEAGMEAQVLPARVEAAADPVIEIAQRTIDGHLEYMAKCDAWNPSEEAMIEWQKKNPMPEMRAYQVNPNEAFHISTGKFFDIEQPASDYVPGADMNAAIAEHKAAIGRWKRRERSAERRTGYRAADAEKDHAANVSMNAIEALRDARPRTLAGLIAKARAARVVHVDEVDVNLAASIVWDIGALAGEVKPEEGPAV